MTCENCKMTDGKVLKVIKARNPKDNIELKYAGGFCNVSGHVLCWFCATPNVGRHL